MLVIGNGGFNTSISRIVQDRQSINIRSRSRMQDDDPPEPQLIQVPGPLLAQLRDLQRIAIKAADHDHGGVGGNMALPHFVSDVIPGIQRKKTTLARLRFDHANRIPLVEAQNQVRRGAIVKPRGRNDARGLLGTNDGARNQQASDRR